MFPSSGIKSFMCPLPKAAAPIATSPGKVYDLTHYLKGALAGGIGSYHDLCDWHDILREP